MALEKHIHCFCKKYHSGKRADSRRDKHAEIKVAYTCHKGLVKSQGHEQRGKAESRCDNTKRKAHAAEKIPEKVWGYLYGKEQANVSIES